MRAAYTKFHVPLMAKTKAAQLEASKEPAVGGEEGAAASMEVEASAGGPDDTNPLHAMAVAAAAGKAKKLSDYRKVGEAILAQPVGCACVCAWMRAAAVTV